MSSIPLTLSLLTLPLFWALLAPLSHRAGSTKLRFFLSRLTIAGTVALFATLLAIYFWTEPTTSSQLLLKLNPVNTAIITVVVVIGSVIVRYSRNYMVGEACYPAFFRWMKLTLAAVVVTLMANHLLVFWLGWLCVSLSLHRLILLYPDRPRAVLGAHKKFLLARLSESLIFIAFVLLYWVFDTAYIDSLMIAVTETPALTTTEQRLVEAAAILLASAAILKCAQLPFHGWLINIVEAPTPVSALLHAGVINLGGYLLLAFAPLVAAFSSAQWLLLTLAGISTLLAALIMSTRISIKVRLAWSTSSQMGLMLIECALGLYELALLHLVAHALYKAYAFLNSGNAVREQVTADIAGSPVPGLRHWVFAIVAVGIIVAALVWIADNQWPLAPWLLLGFSFVTLLTISAANGSRAQWLFAIATLLALTASYLLAKFAVGTYLIEHFPAPVAALSAMDLWMCLLFTTLFVLTWWMRLQAGRPLVRRTRQALFAGLYLDEWFTRMTLKLWPVLLRMSTPRSKPTASISRLGSR